MSDEEYVYLDRDNTIIRELLVDDPQGATTTILPTRCQVLIGETLIDSSVTPAYFDLSVENQIKIKLSASDLLPGVYRAKLYIFDASHSNGLYWDKFKLVVES